MEKKRYKTPKTRWAVVDSEEFLRIESEMFHASVGLEEGDFVGDRVPVVDDPNNQFSKDAGSWEMEW